MLFYAIIIINSILKTQFYSLKRTLESWLGLKK